MGVGLMKITIDIDSLEISELSDKISLSDFICLAKCYLGQPTELPSCATDLQINGYIKLTSDTTFELLEKGIVIFSQKSENILDLAKQIRELFPAGVKSGGYLVRNSEVDIANKLRGFFKKHKYSHEEVLEATKRYVERKRSEGWKFMQRAIYFIEKDGSSTLASECDELDNAVIDDDWTREIK